MKRRGGAAGGMPIDAGVGGVEGGAFRGSIRMGGFDAADLLVSAISTARRSYIQARDMAISMFGCWSSKAPT